jgi:hypothetical protein
MILPPKKANPKGRKLQAAKAPQLAASIVVRIFTTMNTRFCVA